MLCTHFLLSLFSPSKMQEMVKMHRHIDIYYIEFMYIPFGHFIFRLCLICYFNNNNKKKQFFGKIKV